jgi:hypothetical protein
VLYTSSSKDASAVVVTPEDFDAQFICDHKAYWFETGNKQEANYVAAFLNSRIANTLMKDFQSTGLFGPRDVHKTILMLPLPKFSSKNAAHVELARTGGECAAIARAIAKKEDKEILDPRALGRLRSAILRELKVPLLCTDELLRDIMSRAEVSSVAPRRIRKRVTTSKELFG